MAFAQKKKAEIDNKVYHGRVEKNMAPMDYDIEAACKREPHSTVRFMNLDNKTVDVPFTKNLPRQARDKDGNPTGEFARDKKGNVMWETERYLLFPGKLYCLPNRIINELTDLKYPVYEDQPDPETGQMRSVITGYQPRFSLQQEGLSTEFEGPTRAKKKVPEKEKEAQL